MPVCVRDDGGDALPAFAGAVHKLSYHGAVWAKAVLNADASAVTIGYDRLPGAASLLPIIHVQLGIRHPVGCMVQASAVKSWPTQLHKVLDRPVRGAEQLLDLLDGHSQPWAEIEIGDRVHLFDLAGRERVRIIRTWDDCGSRLVLRCWDESGYEVGASEFLTP